MQVRRERGLRLLGMLSATERISLEELKAADDFLHEHRLPGDIDVTVADHTGCTLLVALTNCLLDARPSGLEVEKGIDRARDLSYASQDAMDRQVAALQTLDRARSAREPIPATVAAAEAAVEAATTALDRVGRRNPTTSRENRIDMVISLISEIVERGADVNRLGCAPSYRRHLDPPLWQSPLQAALAWSSCEVATTLLFLGANPNVVGHGLATNLLGDGDEDPIINGATPALHLAMSQVGFPVALLLRARADPNARDDDGTTTLMQSLISSTFNLCAFHRFIAHVDDWQLDLHARDEEGWTVLHYAVMMGSAEAVRDLLLFVTSGQLQLTARTYEDAEEPYDCCKTAAALVFVYHNEPLATSLLSLLRAATPAWEKYRADCRAALRQLCFLDQDVLSIVFEFLDV